MATLAGYVDILLNRIAFVESVFDNLLACSMVGSVVTMIDIDIAIAIISNIV